MEKESQWKGTKRGVIGSKQQSRKIVLVSWVSLYLVPGRNWLNRFIRASWTSGKFSIIFQYDIIHVLKYLECHFVAGSGADCWLPPRCADGKNLEAMLFHQDLAFN